MKKSLSIFIAVVLIAMMMPVGAFTVDAISRTAESATERIEELKKIFPSGSYFSVNGNACGHTSSEKCWNCNLVNILKRDDLKAYRFSDGGSYTCLGFGKFAWYFIHGEVWSGSYDFVINKGTPNKDFFSQAVPGDMIYYFNSSGEFQHAAIFCSASDTSAVVYHANTGGVPNKVSFGSWSYSSMASEYGSGSYARLLRIKGYVPETTTSYTVIFNANGGTTPTAIKTVTCGSTYGTLPTPTKDNCVFEGWYTSPNGGTRIYSDTNVTLTNDQTLYAHWTEIHSHNYVTGNDKSHPHKEYKKCSTCGDKYYTGNTKKVSGCEECYPHEHSYSTGYNSAHPHEQYKKCSGCGEVVYTGSTQKVSGCEECYPHKHSYNTGYDTLHPHKQFKYCSCGEKNYTGSTKKESGCPECYPGTDEQYLFDLNGKLGDKGIMDLRGVGTVDIYINGTCVANDVQDYYKKVPAGSTYEITDIKPAKGYRYSKVYQGGITKSLTGTVNGPVEIWLEFTDGTETVQSYTITYNANGGEKAPASQTKNAGENIKLRNIVPYKQGYVFTGWAESLYGNVKYYPNDTYSADKNLTLYAVWKVYKADTISLQTSVTIPTFKVTLSGRTINNTYRQYPLIVYNDITYFPMTYYDSRLMGLETGYSQAEGLSIWQTSGNFSYQETNSSTANSGTYTATVAQGPIYVNGKFIDNGNEEYPLLLFRDVTYFPLTWRFAVQEFGWSYYFDMTNGLVISK